MLKLIFQLIIGCVIFASTADAMTDGLTDKLTNDLFTRLLKESGLQFSLPSGFVDVKTETNSVQHYERALRHRSGSLEIRYIIRPLGRITIDYNDPHNAAPEPNHLYPLLFESLTARLSNGRDAPHSEYPLSQAHELFNADWAAASIFDVEPDFSDTYRQALLLAIHKNTKADAYTVFLYNEPLLAKEIIQNVLSNLVFADLSDHSELGKKLDKELDDIH